MRRYLLLAVLGLSACDREPREPTGAPAPASTEAAVPAKPARSEAPSLVPRPKDQAELDRLIVAGYTPHSDHLHAPGVKNCPLAKEGNEAVM